MKAHVELKSVDMKMSNERDFISCLARLSRAEAWTGYGNGFFGCHTTNEGLQSVRRAIKSFDQTFSKGSRLLHPIHGQPDDVFSGLHLKSLFFCKLLQGINKSLARESSAGPPEAYRGPRAVR